MANSPAVCAKCYAELPILRLNTNQKIQCTSCLEDGYGYVYPAYFDDTRTTIKKDKAVEGDAACFFHESHAAKTACNSCGKFICESCEIDFGGGTHCPECIGNGRVKGLSFKSSAKRYDLLALLLALLPFTLAFWFIGFLSAPASIFLTIKYWSKKDTTVPFNRWRFVVAGLLSVGFIVLVVAVIFQIIDDF